MTPAFALGELTVRIVSDGTFALDGGAVFGVVPRVLWEQHLPPDARHRVRLGLNCLLVAFPDGRHALIDTGLGDRWTDEEQGRMGVEHGSALVRRLAEAGLSPEDIDVVVLSHLHFDHAGGCVRRRDDGALVPVFPRARHVVQRSEWEAATHPHARSRASYRRDDFAPLEVAGLVDVVDGDSEVLPGLTVQRVAGHCPGLQVAWLESRGAVLAFPSDIIPTVAHVAAAWTMAFDMDVAATVAAKQALLARCLERGALACLDHEDGFPLVRFERRADRGREIIAALPAHEVVPA